MYLELLNFFNLINMVIDKLDIIYLFSFGDELYIVIFDVVGEKICLVVKLCVCEFFDIFDKIIFVMGCFVWWSVVFKCLYFFVF